MKVAVLDVAQLGKIMPPTAQQAIRQRKALSPNVTRQYRRWQQTSFEHRKCDWWSTSVRANPLNIQLSGFSTKAVRRAYHQYAIPRLVNRWAGCDCALR